MPDELPSGIKEVFILLAMRKCGSQDVRGLRNRDRKSSLQPPRRANRFHLARPMILASI